MENSRAKRMYDEFMAGPRTSRAKAVKMKCLECVCFEDITRNVGGCTVKKCALWTFRPYQPGEADDVEG